jgi:hypothetical protein
MTSRTAGTLAVRFLRSWIAIMPRKASKFTKSEIARAIKAAQSLGLDIAGFEVAPEGTIKVNAGKPVESEVGKASNPLDRVLRDDYNPA